MSQGYEWFVAEQSDTLQYDVTYFVNSDIPNKAQVLTEAYSKDPKGLFDKPELKEEADAGTFGPSKTTNINGHQVIVNNAYVAPKSIDGKDLTQTTLEQALNLKPGETGNPLVDKRVNFWQNYTPEMLSAVIETKENKKLTTYETIATINPDILKTEAVIIQSKTGALPKPLTVFAGQKAILEASGIQISREKQKEEFGKTLVSIVDWGEHNIREKGQTFGRAGSVENPQENSLVRDGFVIAYGRSEKNEIHITIQNTQGNGGEVVIELYPSPTDLFTKPQVKQAFIDFNGKQIPLELNKDGSPDFAKIQWLFDKKPVVLQTPTTPDIMPIANAQTQAEAWKKYQTAYNAYAGDTSNLDKKNALQKAMDELDEANRAKPAQPKVAPTPVVTATPVSAPTPTPAVPAQTASTVDTKAPEPMTETNTEPKKAEKLAAYTAEQRKKIEDDILAEWKSYITNPPASFKTAGEAKRVAEQYIDAVIAVRDGTEVTAGTDTYDIIQKYTRQFEILPENQVATRLTQALTEAENRINRTQADETTRKITNEKVRARLIREIVDKAREPESQILTPDIIEKILNEILG